MESSEMFRSPKRFGLCKHRARAMMRNCCIGTLLVLATGHQGFAQSNQANIVVVRPKEIHDVLVNPGMGITTFQRFNGQVPNPPLKWSEVGPVTKLPQAPTKPDFSDALFRKYWGELVAQAGKRYDGNPYLDSVDISSVGYWGEGWSPYMPAFAYQKELIDIWLEAFRRTPLLMNFDEQQALTHGTAHGAGWRLDCLGDMRTSSTNPYFPAEMLEIYPQQVVRAGIQDVWQHKPVSLEVGFTVAGWKERGYDVDYILDQALRWHVTSVNIKSSPIPSEWKSQFESFQKKMG